MKKFVATVCILASTLGLAACAGEGNVETAAPYAEGRTAGSEAEQTARTRRIDRTYRKAQRK